MSTDRFQWLLLGFALAAAMMAAWTAWLVFATVPVKVVSSEARLERDGQAHPLQVEAPGRVARLEVRVGDRVQRGTLLLELEAPELVEQIAAAREEFASVEQRVHACGVALEAQSDILALADGAGRAARDEALAEVDEARVSAGLAAEDARRVERLHADRSISDMELLEAQAEAERSAAALRARAQRPAQLAYAHEREASDLMVEIEELRGGCAMLEGERARQQAAIATLERELERRRVRAPADGEIIELGRLPVGTWVAAGEPLGTLLPDGDLTLIAWFEPGASLGRLAPGQPALFRADAFPWLQHGALEASVIEVAGETRSGRLRADLALPPSGTAGFTPRHGLSGTVEVEVERCSPASLVLRAAGARLGSPVGREEP